MEWCCGVGEPERGFRRRRALDTALRHRLRIEQAAVSAEGVRDEPVRAVALGGSIVAELPDAAAAAGREQADTPVLRHGTGAYERVENPRTILGPRWPVVLLGIERELLVGAARERPERWIGRDERIAVAARKQQQHRGGPGPPAHHCDLTMGTARRTGSRAARREAR